MLRSRLAALSLIVAFLFSVRSEGEKSPSVLTCRSNAKVSRGYAFGGRQWEGPTDQANVPFDVQTRESKIAGLYYALRDKVFSGLNGNKPVVRSITRLADGTDMGEDFAARVVSRTANAVFILWTNDQGSKMWLAVVDVAHRKATLSQVAQGLTSSGGELETLDCQ